MLFIPKGEPPRIDRDKQQEYPQRSPDKLRGQRAAKRAGVEQRAHNIKNQPRGENLIKAKPSYVCRKMLHEIASLLNFLYLYFSIQIHT